MACFCLRLTQVHHNEQNEQLPLFHPWRAKRHIYSNNTRDIHRNWKVCMCVRMIDLIDLLMALVFIYDCNHIWRWRISLEQYIVWEAFPTCLWLSHKTLIFSKKLKSPAIVSIEYLALFTGWQSCVFALYETVDIDTKTEDNRSMLPDLSSQAQHPACDMCTYIPRAMSQPSQVPQTSPSPPGV